MFLAKSYCDIGNYSAGYMAGISGQGWEASRAAFDALESVQMRGFSTEAMVSQAAEKAGFDRGHKKYWQQQYEVQRMLQEGRVHTWYLQPIITQYFIDNKSEIWLLFLIAHSKR